jgi:hypothetical protein
LGGGGGEGGGKEGGREGEREVVYLIWMTRRRAGTGGREKQKDSEGQSEHGTHEMYSTAQFMAAMSQCWGGGRKEGRKDYIQYQPLRLKGERPQKTGRREGRKEEITSNASP